MSLQLSNFARLVILICVFVLPARTATSDDAFQPNNQIVLACDIEDGSAVNIQKIHTTIRPQDKFFRENGV